MTWAPRGAVIGDAARAASQCDRYRARRDPTTTNAVQFVLHARKTGVSAASGRRCVPLGRARGRGGDYRARRLPADVASPTGFEATPRSGPSAGSLRVEPIRAEDDYGGWRATIQARVGAARITVQVDADGVLRARGSLERLLRTAAAADLHRILGSPGVERRPNWRRCLQDLPFSSALNRASVRSLSKSGSRRSSAGVKGSGADIFISLSIAGIAASRLPSRAQTRACTSR